MIPRSRQDFKKYILTSLGAPVINVDVVDSQIEDRIDEAIDYFQQYHFEGLMHGYMKLRCTASEIHIKEQLKEVPAAGTKITGQTSKATAEVVEYAIGSKSNNRTILCKDVIKNSFIPGEKIKVGEKIYTIRPVCDVTTREANPKDQSYITNVDIEPIKLGIIDEKRFKVPDCVLGVISLIPFHYASSSANLLTAEAQTRINIFDLFDLSSTSIIYYEQIMEHMNLLHFELNPNPSFDFNRHEGYVYPQCKWNYDIRPGDYFVCEVYRAMDPKDAPGIWNNTWLKRYAVCLTKIQWSNNLKKYGGIQLVGGITLNGSEMYQEAIAERKELEDQLLNNLPPSAFMIG